MASESASGTAGEASATTESSPISLYEWLASGPFGLTMSSGFFSFFAHTGMLLALHRAGLRPVAVSGSSAGALVGSLYAAGCAPEDIRSALLRLHTFDFLDPGPGLGPGVLRGRRFRKLLADLLPVHRFEACEIPVAVSTFDVVSRKTRVFNHGPMVPAVHASCAVPGLFQPVWIGGRPQLDGGLSDRPGLAGMREYRVLYHHIASRSPWRREGSPSLELPKRSGLRSLVLSGLPRSGPFKLEAGHAALRIAYDEVSRRLEGSVLEQG